ncbi:alpha/beta hydrolase [Thermoflexibacter ruber]|uniref:Acetyl esterase/lipase n=1 Tax=Thermoflexibacter ruber TaxID=1003 RepID=A0A1I2AJF3_9BACT|nr:alpha/beta hydrolase [Thermoflexibacter ruber]SFE42980.1 Acetyl esterase/lipase [Thermoflexibacter ruber]
MKKILFLVLWVGTSLIVYAQQDSLLLYPDGVPGAIPLNIPEKVTVNPNDGVTITTDIQQPKLFVYRPQKPNGASVLICPGGGYYVLAIDHEGHQLAKWFIERGVTAFVLKNRLPDERLMTEKHIRPLQDAQQALRIIRKNAKKWNLDTNKVGIMGFSAGGHLAATVGTRFQKQVGEITDNTLSVRPNFMILIYPLISFRIGTDRLKGIQDKLLGKEANELLIDEYCLDKQVTSETPPTFIVYASDDSLNPEHGIVFYRELQKNKVPAELHIYEKGGHGFSLSKKNRGHVEAWDREMEGWLRDRKLIE